MSRYYSAEWSARTRGAKWRTVTGKTEKPLVASSLHVAVREAVKVAERPYGRLAAINLHVIEVGTVPPVRCATCGHPRSSHSGGTDAYCEKCLREAERDGASSTSARHAWQAPR